jgi:hypothetical protein
MIKCQGEQLKDLVFNLQVKDYRRAYVVRKISDPSTKKWLNNNVDDETLVVSMGGFHVQDLPIDAVVVKNDKLSKALKKSSVPKVYLSPSAFNAQHGYWRYHKGLTNWSGGIFHLNQELLGAIHLCMKCGVSNVKIVDVNVDGITRRTFDRRMVIKVLAEFIQNHGLRLKHTKTSDLLSRIQNVEVEASKDTTDIDNTVKISKPRISSIFANNHVSYDFNSNGTCAVVGNSGRLLEKRHGEAIDAHDCVVRFNAAPVKSYEKFVGSRTDFRFVNEVIMKGHTLEYTETKKNWLADVEGERLVMKPSKDKDYRNAVMLAGNENEIYFLSENAERKIKTFEKRHDVRKASLGLVGVVTMMNLFEKVTLFGFGFHQEDSLQKRHYWEKFNQEATGGHQWKQERRIILSMNKKGYLNFVP